MLLQALCLATIVLSLASPAAAQDRSASDVEEQRCTQGGQVCITQSTYVADVCRTIELAAEAENLDVGFFARLLWRESLYDAGAVSHAGAQGIAQFMPATAALRGLQDPFNPAEAILASAAYLKELEERYGNLGLAAAAYNAGEDRVERFLAGASGLPRETRDYVLAITDYPAEVWREGPLPLPDLALEPGQPFQETCLARAESRDMPSFQPETSALLPWAVVIAGQDSQEAAEREAQRIAAGHATLLGGDRIDYTFTQYPGMQQPRHFAQIGRGTRVEAEELCQQLSAAGAGCTVRRN